MTRQQFNKTIETVINSPRNNLQMISVLQNAFALYVQEETDRIVEQLEEKKEKYLDGFNIHKDRELYGVACGFGDSIKIIKAGGKV